MTSANQDILNHQASRQLAKLAEAVHGCGYYPGEIKGFNNLGFRGWWHAYFAYRSAPLGQASEKMVTATFYNFAPRMVAKSIPSCWEIMTPAVVRSQHLEFIDQAMHRIFSDDQFESPFKAVHRILRPIDDKLPVAGRPLYAAWASEVWPEDSMLAVWHAVTLLREFRFDGHNIALLAGELDPTECHVMMAADGRGDPATIQRIRGWTAEEWKHAAQRLIQRGLIDERGKQTVAGRVARKDVEHHTDRLANSIIAVLADNIEPLLKLLSLISDRLLQSGEIPGIWPPPNVAALTE
ncbi:MAG: hypothetical protein P8K71_02405 [Actinomycetota bacterium]|nr:hypothetical protein [Actinomycetota bacterium]